MIDPHGSHFPGNNTCFWTLDTQCLFTLFIVYAGHKIISLWCRCYERREKETCLEAEKKEYVAVESKSSKKEKIVKENHEAQDQSLQIQYLSSQKDVQRV